jgi:hypothetical protein
MNSKHDLDGTGAEGVNHELAFFHFQFNVLLLVQRGGFSMIIRIYVSVIFIYSVRFIAYPKY